MLVINKNEIIKKVKLDNNLHKIIENGFIELSKGNTIMPPILRLDIKEFHGETDIKTAYIMGQESFAIKIASAYFNNNLKGLPTGNGLMILVDAKTGEFKSILLDYGYLTDLRTAVAGGIASKYLSNQDSSNVGIIGAGVQAKLQLKSIMMHRNIKKVIVWARDINKANIFIKEYNDKNLNMVVANSCEELASLSDIIVTATPSQTPLLKYEWLKKGTHITAMGSDAKHKNELDPAMIKLCNKYIPDNQSQTRILGELNHAIKKNFISSNYKFDDLGSIILNPSLGRKNREDITICDLTGTGVQDTAIARYTYNLLKK